MNKAPLLCLSLAFLFTACAGNDSAEGSSDSTDDEVGTEGDGDGDGESGTESGTESSTDSSTDGETDSSTDGGTDSDTTDGDTTDSDTTDGDTTDGDTTDTGGMCEGSGEPCGDCIASECCSELQACNADQDCACMLECITTMVGDPPTCAAMCNLQAAPAELEALAGCTTMSCGEFCN